MAAPGTFQKPFPPRSAHPHAPGPLWSKTRRRERVYSPRIAASGFGGVRKPTNRSSGRESPLKRPKAMSPRHDSRDDPPGGHATHGPTSLAKIFPLPGLDPCLPLEVTVVTLTARGWAGWASADRAVC